MLEYMTFNYYLALTFVEVDDTKIFHSGDFKTLPIEQNKSHCKKISEIEKTVLKEASTNII